MQFTGKMWLMIILKVKKQGFILSLENKFLKKTLVGGGGTKLIPSGFLGLSKT